MLRVVQQGIGWSVLRNGQLVHDEHSSGVHKTHASAVSHAKRAAVEAGEQIDFGQAPIADGDILILHSEAAPPIYLVGPAHPGGGFIRDVQPREVNGREAAEDAARTLMRNAQRGRIYLVEQTTGEWSEVPGPS